MMKFSDVDVLFSTRVRSLIRKAYLKLPPDTSKGNGVLVNFKSGTSRFIVNGPFFALVIFHFI